MSFPAILIGVALLLASILIVAGPLLRSKRLKPEDEKKNPIESQKSYEQSLLALRDLDFDHQLGVVAEDDYQQLRASLLTEAAEAYEQTAPGEGDLEQLIETAVRDRRQHFGNSNGHSRCSSCGADTEPADKYCVTCGLHALSTCPQCNQSVEQGNNFCTSCGAQLTIAEGVIL